MKPVAHYGIIDRQQPEPTRTQADRTIDNIKKKLFAAALLVSVCGPVMAGEFDQHNKACHDAAWAQDEFKDIPNAGISAYPGGYDDKTYYAYWIIDWDDVQVAGKCMMELKTPKILKLTDFRKK